MAGHSKWANIKHRKGRQDALRGKLNTKLIREITVAAKEAGGDPDSNPRLRLAIDKANRSNVTKDSIKKAIDKGVVNTSGEDYFEVMYEGYASGGIALLVNCLTDNKNRTVSEVRHAFSKCGGNLGTDGSVAYLFERKGVIGVKATADKLEDLMDACMDLPVEELDAIGDDALQIITSPNDFTSVLEEVKTLDCEVVHAELSWLAHQSMAIDQEATEKLERLESMLEELDDVQAVFHNAEVSN